MRSRCLLAMLAIATVASGLAAVPASAIPPPLNLVNNGNFETGGINHWRCEDSRATVSPGSIGLYALDSVVSTNSTGRCSQTVAVRPNSTYQLSAYVRGHYVHLGAVGYKPSWTPSASPWTRLINTFTTGPGTDTIEVYVHGWYNQGRFAADEITLFGSSPLVPAQPSDVRVTGVAARSVNLAWRPVAGVAGYRVYLGPTLITETDGPSPTATVAALAANSTYELQVTAYNRISESTRSAPITATTLTDTVSPPYAPRSVYVSAGPEGTLWTAWEAVQPASLGYRVYLNGTPIARTVGPAYQVTGLGKSTTHRIEVTALNANGESPRSRVAYGTTLPAGAIPPPM